MLDKPDLRGDTVRYSLLYVLACIPGCSGGSSPRQWTPEEQAVIAVAQQHLQKAQPTWETPIEVTPPPNRVNVPDWKKYFVEEKNNWKVVYETPREEMRALGARTLFVNMSTKEVTPSIRK